MTATIITLLAAGSLALNAALLVALLALFRRSWREAVVSLVRGNGRILMFLLALGAVGGSLFMQYANGLQPCLFCWWQRIFMYPTLIIAIVAIIKNANVSEFADYILTLSFFGAAVSLYQHLLQMLPTGTLIPCDATGECAVRSVFEFNFVTLPWMAFSVFVALVFVALLARKKA